VTASYRLLVKREAEKELRRLPRRDLKRILGKIGRLAAEPRPEGVEKLSTLERYRVRQGDYRVLYEIDDEAQTVTVVRIGHRREVYR
jgi:mRNA interferase RelE/StbE